MIDKNYNRIEAEKEIHEMVNLLKVERTCYTAKERETRLKSEVYDPDCGYIDGGEVQFDLDYVDYMLISGHAFTRAYDRSVNVAELVEMAREVANNFDAFCAIDDNRVLPAFDNHGRVIGGVGEYGKTATVVQMEGSNILLVVERYENGIRVASCWNTNERPYGLQEHDAFIFVRKDGSVTSKLTGDVFVFPKTKRG